MKTILAVSAVLLASCASAPKFSPINVHAQAPSKITVIADRSVTQSDADDFRRVALDTVKDVGALSVEISLKSAVNYRLDAPLAASPGTNYTVPSISLAMSPLPMGGDGAIMNGGKTNVAQPYSNFAFPPSSFTAVPGDSVDLTVKYVIRDASGVVVDKGAEAIRFTSSDHARSYQNAVKRIAERVKRFSGSH